VPVLRRPHRVQPLVKSIIAATPGAHVFFLSDREDHEEQSAINAEWTRNRGKAAGIRFTHQATGGNYAEKINHGVRHSTESLLFLGADDLDFHPGWFEAAIAKLTPGIGVVGTNDLGSPRVMAGEHATHPLVTREYATLGTIDDPGKLLHEAYPHEFVDDEFVQTAKHRNAFVSARDSHVEHMHPSWSKAPLDDLYRAQRERMREGRPIFNARRHLWT
jgi:hypothetical protein